MPRAEVWKPIGCDRLYQVSNYGPVRWSDGRLKGATSRPDGTLVVNLYAHGRTNVRAVHSLVAEAFLGPLPSGYMVVHSDHKPENCKVDNLAQVPLSLRRATPGAEMSGKLTRAQALEIRSRARNGESTKRLAGEFGVSAPLVSNIKTGKMEGLGNNSLVTCGDAPM